MNRYLVLGVRLVPTKDSWEEIGTQEEIHAHTAQDAHYQARLQWEYANRKAFTGEHLRGYQWECYEIRPLPPMKYGPKPAAPPATEEKE